MVDDTLNTFDSDPSGSETPWGMRFADRYELRTAIGAGGSGDVWAARDRITSDDVAIKLLPALTGGELSRVRREVTALRRARIPGVVRLRDDGLQGGTYFLVTDLFEGEPFPGRRGAVPWAELAPIALRLLHIVDRVHRLGVIHRDLKPGNVLVSASGEPCVLDFGIAGGDAVGDDSGDGIRATPRYAAPERLRGQPGDARTDLYGLGAMLYEALTGEPTHPVSYRQPEDWIRLRSTSPPPVGGRAEVPARVAAAIDAMLAPDPDDRPASAYAVLRVLTPDAPDPLAAVPLPPAHASEEALREVFAGPDAFLWLRTDGARALWQRTGGEPGAVRAELRAWIDGGLATVADGRIAVERAALDRLLASHTRLRDGPGETDVGPEPEPEPEAIDAVLDRGEIGPATGLTELGLAMARDAGDAAREEALLLRAVACALAAQSTSAIDWALYELGRATARTDEVEAAEHLVRASAAAERRETQRARDHLAAAHPLRSERFEIWARLVEIRIGWGEGVQAQEEAAEAMLRWAETGSKACRMHALGQLGNVRYRQERYPDAAALHLAALSLRPVEARVPSLLSVAMVLLELGEREDLDKALEYAEEAQARADACRSVEWSLRACWTVRTTRYRRGEPLEADRALVEAAERVGGYHAALFALNEAAVAWRRGDPALAAELSRFAEECTREQSNVHLLALAGALRIACRGPRDDADLERIVSIIDRCTISEIAAQAWGLLHIGRPSPDLTKRACEAAARCPSQRWRKRLDVISLDEATARSGEGATETPPP